MPSYDNVEPVFEAFMRANLTPESVFVDAGAGFGDYTKLASEYITLDFLGDTFAFEPDMRSAIEIARFQQYLIQTGSPAAQTVKLFNFPLSHADGMVPFDIAAVICMSSTCAGAVDSQNLVGTAHQNAQRLDSLITRFDILKVDVNGDEDSVIYGAGKTLSKDRPMAVLVKCYPNLGTKTSDTLDILGRYGFLRGAMWNQDGQRPYEDGSIESIVALKYPSRFLLPEGALSPGNVAQLAVMA